MIINYIITKFGNTTRYIPPTFILAHTYKACRPLPPENACLPPTQETTRSKTTILETKGSGTTGSGTTESGITGSGTTESGTKGSETTIRLKRTLKSAPVRLGFLPEEWFRFFHGKTGVSGPYIFGIGLTNYLLSKEIYVLEHEYYMGWSILSILYYTATTFGKSIGDFLDKDVDSFVNVLEKLRKDEESVFENEIKEAELDQFRAQGQKMLMEAKKENIAMQLEAAYRERLSQALKAVKGRMDYQVKLHRANNRIQQKWMIGWIIKEVNKSLTPEFEKRVFDSAIQHIAAAASQVK